MDKRVFDVKLIVKLNRTVRVDADDEEQAETLAIEKVCGQHNLDPDDDEAYVNQVVEVRKQDEEGEED